MWTVSVLDGKAERRITSSTQGWQWVENLEKEKQRGREQKEKRRERKVSSWLLSVQRHESWVTTVTELEGFSLSGTSMVSGFWEYFSALPISFEYVHLRVMLNDLQDKNYTGLPYKCHQLCSPLTCKEILSQRFMPSWKGGWSEFKDVLGVI